MIMISVAIENGALADFLLPGDVADAPQSTAFSKEF